MRGIAAKRQESAPAPNIYDWRLTERGFSAEGRRFQSDALFSCAATADSPINGA